MAVLGGHSAHRCFAQCGVLFERFEEDFYWPSFLIGRQKQSAAHGRITASQIEHSRAAVSECVNDLRQLV